MQQFKNWLVAVMIVFFSFSVVPQNFAEAKSGSFSSRSSSSPLRSGSAKSTTPPKVNNGYTGGKTVKPVNSTKKQDQMGKAVQPAGKTPPVVDNGYKGKPGQNQSTVKGSGVISNKGNKGKIQKPMISPVAQKQLRQRNKDAMAAYKAEKNAYKQPPSSQQPVVNQNSGFMKNVRDSGAFDRSTYHARRSDFYSSRGWSRPVYVNHFYPSYGGFDTNFLLWVLVYDDLFFHHHRSDPNVQAFLAENRAVDAQQATKIAELEGKLAAMQGQPIDTNYVPDGVDADIVLAPDVIDAMPTQKEKESSSVWIWVLLIAVISGGIVAFIVWGKKSKEKEEREDNSYSL